MAGTYQVIEVVLKHAYYVVIIVLFRSYHSLLRRKADIESLTKKKRVPNPLLGKKPIEEKTTNST